MNKSNTLSNSQKNEPKIQKIFSENWCNSHFKEIKYSYIWTINNFSLYDNTLNDSRPIYSSPFSSAAIKNPINWRLCLYPKGKDDIYKDFISVFLEYHSTSSVFAKFTFYILNSKGEKCNVQKTAHSFVYLRNSTPNTAGFHDFIKRDILTDETNNLMQDDRLTICSEIVVGEYVKEIYSHMNTNGNWCFCSTTNCIILSKSDNLRHNSTDDKLRVCSDLELLLKNNDFSDITLIADGKRFKAHKCILSARSPVFSAMFQHDMKEKQQNVVEITDIHEEVLKGLLQFMYAGKVENIQKLAARLIVAADKYQLHDLKDLCEDALANNLTMDNVANILIIADLHSAFSIKIKAIQFIIENIREIVDMPGFQSMTKSHNHLITEILYSMAKKKEE